MTEGFRSRHSGGEGPRRDQHEAAGSAERQEPKAEAIEHSFEQGLGRVTDEVLSRLEKIPCVAVAVRSTGQHVGKSSFARALRQRLGERGVHSISQHDERELKAKGAAAVDAEKHGTDRTGYDPQKMVFILDQMVMLDDFIERVQEEKLNGLYDKQIAEAAAAIGYRLDAADVIWVGISRPDKPFRFHGNQRPPIDIFISNEKATDK